SELVFQRGAPPETVYTFKHALVQDAAHDSLLRNARRRLHAQIAEALETHSPEIIESQPELLAQHYAEAGLDELAIEWWRKAGDQALRRSTFKEAAAHLGKAIELADKLAATAPSAAPAGNRLHLQTSLGNALIWAKGYYAPETSAAFARSRIGEPGGRRLGTVFRLLRSLGRAPYALRTRTAARNSGAFPVRIRGPAELSRDLGRTSHFRHDLLVFRRLCRRP
ncbi:MAG TPA: hypothetical protein VE993_14405, partial [Stellaceae bacterium]|nr:hypothetical protein [Stellaceae bacterium]